MLVKGAGGRSVKVLRPDIEGELDGVASQKDGDRVSLLAGDLEPLFPYLAKWFVGAAAGLALLEATNRRRLLSVGGLAAVGVLLTGILFSGQGAVTVGNTRPGTGNYLLLVYLDADPSRQDAPKLPGRNGLGVSLLGIGAKPTRGQPRETVVPTLSPVVDGGVSVLTSLWRGGSEGVF